MNISLLEFDELTCSIADQLRKNFNYSRSAVDNYRTEWRKVRVYLEATGYSYYSPDLNLEIQEYMLSERLNTDRKKSHIQRSLRILSECHLTGTFKTIPMPKKLLRELGGSLGLVISDFLRHCREQRRLSEISINCHRRNLEKLYDYALLKDINAFDAIDLSFLLLFIKNLEGRMKTEVPVTLSTLRAFIGYLFNTGIIPKDYSALIPRARTINQPKLPSTYSKEEVAQVIRAVDRSTGTGKRNYAIILMAARFGLRASDIGRLRFDHLDWQQSKIEMDQYKTGKKLILPILADVGNAIIDYLKYGRPKMDSPYVFLTARPPFEPFPSSNVVTHIVQRAFLKSGVSIANKRFGPHSLRHSLGFQLLQESVVLPIISEVLGHQSTESTRYYLRIDLESMRQCVLDVPPVDKAFYLQKGGIFYG
ncbi:integrase [Pedobacter sp. CG_S7]|uniref:site-specific integrase n=1 Tax=Pedobacter sp. CG_S7 TaxID=3143930 RepID=UPI003391D90D